MIDQFERQWIVEKLAALVRSQRAKYKLPDNAQLLLGLRMPKRLVLKSGKTIRRDEATLRVLRQHRARLWKTRAAGIQEIDSAIAFLLPYAREERGITFAKALELEAKRTK